MPKANHLDPLAIVARCERAMWNAISAAEENRELFLGTVKALAAAIDGKDPYTRGHSERVSRFSVATAVSVWRAGGYSSPSTPSLSMSLASIPRDGC